MDFDFSDLVGPFSALAAFVSAAIAYQANRNAVLVQRLVQDRDSQWHKIVLPTKDVVHWLHPNGWKNRRRDWDRFPQALDAMREQFAYVPIPNLGSVAMMFPSIIPRAPTDPLVEFTIRVPSKAAAGARIDWHRLCQYGTDSAPLYRAYLSTQAHLARSARRGNPITERIAAPVLNDDGNPKRQKGGKIVRSTHDTEPNPAARFAGLSVIRITLPVTNHPPATGAETMTAPAANLPALTPSAALALDKHPAAVYLASLAAGPGRVSMRSTLRQVAAMLGCTLESCPWHELRFAHVAALRSQLADRYAPATANKYLSAIRRTCRQAWLLGLMPGEDYHRIAAVENVKGSRLPAGRALDGGEIGALFACVCRRHRSGRQGCRGLRAHVRLRPSPLRSRRRPIRGFRRGNRRPSHHRQGESRAHRLRHERRAGRGRRMDGHQGRGSGSATGARVEVRDHRGRRRHDAARAHEAVAAPLPGRRHRRVHTA